MGRGVRASVSALAVGLMGAVASPVWADGRPALVVVVVIDQFRGDYLTALGDHFVDGGFKRLMDEGAWFANAYHTYGTTATGPGHATLLTGAPPAVHGIVANDWRDVDGDGRGQYCCGDDTVRPLGFPDGRGERRSPRMLACGTLGDSIKAAGGQVWTIALKDRAAILTGGRQADGAVWWDSHSGNFVSSTYYGSALPDWAASLNADRVADRYFQQRWERLLPEALYRVRLLDAPAAAPAGRFQHANLFPKVLGRGCSRPDSAYYAALYCSPFGNELVFEGARRAISSRKLGQDDKTDLIVLGLSSNDVVGHAFGPGSQEVMDCTLRTDRQLAVFFDWLDKQAGLEKCLVALSSDHGVGPVPEYAADLGLGGGRLSGKAVRDYVAQRLTERFSATAGGERLVQDVNFPWLYLDREAAGKLGVPMDEVARAAAQIAERHPGVARAVALCDVLGGACAGDEDMCAAIRDSFYPSRSGQVYLHWDRYWYKGKTPAGHGSAYDYDRHVPVLLRGPGVAHVTVHRRISPAGLVPTICAVLGIDPPAGAREGVYPEALAAPSARD